MATIDYKQKIKDYMNSSEVDTLYKSMLNNLFPELAESEDERIRKELIRMVKEDWPGRGDVISWLEKQGEQDLEWSKEENDKLSTIIAWIKDYPRLAKFNEKAFVRANNYVEWLKSIRNKYVSIKKIEHLKSQGEQNLAEWSEEDENRINRLIAYFEDKESFTAEDDIVYANWLKSLRPQSHWKPSDEQMHYLSWIANVKLGDSVVEQEISKHLNELLEDLKKLKE